MRPRTRLLTAVLFGDAVALLVQIPASTEDEEGAWYLRWDALAESGEHFAQGLRERLGGRGLRLHLDFGLSSWVPMFSGEKYLALGAAGGPSSFVEWRHLVGHLYALVASYRPDRALQLELAPFAANGAGQVGLFLLQSPSPQMWRFLPQSIQEAWLRFPKFRAHVLLHDVSGWDVPLWRRHLGKAFGALGGFHWCGTVNRNPELNPRLAERRQNDNYFNKVFTMLDVAKHQGYRWVVKLDDDIFLPPFSLMSLVRSGPLGDYLGCGAVLPLTQNGIPSAEIFARAWLQEEDREALFRCFAGSSGQFCLPGSLMTCCWKAQPELGIPEVPVPDPWDEISWYGEVAARFDLKWHKNHPVSGNLSCMLLALSLSLKGIDAKWLLPFHDKANIIVDGEFSYPYFANNIFLMQTERYVRVLQHPSCCSGTDERAMNRLLHEERVPLCFNQETFGVHPAWGNFGQTLKNAIEADTVEALRRFMPEAFFAVSDEPEEDKVDMSLGKRLFLSFAHRQMIALNYGRRFGMSARRLFVRGFCGRAGNLRRERRAEEQVERFNRMLDLCAAAEDFHGAERVLQRLVKESTPNSLSFALVVCASAEARDLARAEHWLRRFYAELGPESWQHPKVAQSLQAAGARSLADAAASFGAGGASAAPLGARRRFEALLEGNSDREEIERVFHEALQEWEHSSTARKHLYQEYLAFLVRGKEKEQVQSRLQEMAALGFPPDAISFGVLINAVAEKGKDVAYARDLFRQAEESGVKPTLPLLNSMLKVCARAADVESAKAWFQKIHSASLKPNILSFNHLLAACATSSMSEAQEILKTMRANGLEPDGFSYGSLVKAAARGEEAELWLRKAGEAGVQADAGMYVAAMRAYFQQPKEVKRLFEEMRDRVPPTEQAWLALAYAHATEGEVERAEDAVFAVRKTWGDRAELGTCLLFAYAKKTMGQRSRKAEVEFRRLAKHSAPSAQALRYLRQAMGDKAAGALLRELGLAEAE
ncbi:unnamed protein product [Effrenium voratum]|nr:unnamed protein product [Effrenium voratum]